MYRSIAPYIMALALFLPPYCLAQPPEPPPEASNADQAQALRETDARLKALASDPEAAKPAAPAQGSSKKGVTAGAKKKKAKGKKAAKKRSKLKAKGAAQAHQEGGKRLTQAQVKAILSTTRDFSGSDLSGLNLSGMDLKQVRFNRANLRLANLERADLNESDLELADLSRANLRAASLHMARLRGTNLEGTRLDGALWVDRTICRSGSLGRCIE